MKILRSATATVVTEAKKGAALLLSFMVLIVIVTIVTQISIGTMTDARVARNDVALARMDLAIESAMLQAQIQLRDDGAADAEAEGEGEAPGGAATPNIGDTSGGDGEDGGATDVPADKKADFLPERTEINQIGLRIHIQDEDSKINLLNMLSEDEDRAEEGFLRVVRVLDMFREGTEFDLEMSDAQEIGDAMRRYMLERDSQLTPKPVLLSDNADNDRLGLPLSMREFLILEEVTSDLFMDFRDDDDTIVHSIESFLTVWSSPRNFSASGSSLGGLPGNDAGAPTNDGSSNSGGGDSSSDTGGFAVNMNTAPPVVLKALFDDRDVNPAFWDEVIEYRNLEDEDAMQDENGERREPVYDEFGEEQLELQYFGTVEDLSEVRSWGDFDAELQGKITEVLKTRSSTFSVIITAIKETGANQANQASMNPRDAARDEEDSPALRRVVRAVVWRHEVEEEIVITPIIPWENLPSSPYEVKDYPDEDR